MRQTKVLRNIWLGIENLLLHKLRSFLTMLGVVFGVGSVVAMLSVGEGASKEALEQIRKLGSNNIIISSMKSAEEEQRSTTRTMMSVYGLTYEDQKRVAESFSTIRRTAPVKLMRKESRLGERTLELRVVATTPEWSALVPREVLAGRVLLPSDEAKQAPVAVLTEFGARKLLATFTKVTSGSFERERVELHQIIVQVDDTKHVEATAAGIEEMLGRFHKKNDYVVSVPLALLKQAESTKRRFNIVLGSIAGISLLVGGIGIMNIMLASVTERTRRVRSGSAGPSAPREGKSSSSFSSRRWCSRPPAA